MFGKSAFLLKHARANVTLEGLDIANAMNRRQVPLHIPFMHQLLAANLALVSGVRMLRSASLSMRRVVVSADRWLVAERHVADLALDTPCPRLLTMKVRPTQTHRLDGLYTVLQVNRETVTTSQLGAHVAIGSCPTYNDYGLVV